MAGQDPSGAGGNEVEQERCGNSAPRVAGHFAESDSAARVIDFRFSWRGGRAGRVSAAPSGVRARGEKVLSLQNGDPPRNCGGPKQLFLSKMSAFTAPFCCAAVTCEKQKKS